MTSKHVGAALVLSLQVYYLITGLVFIMQSNGILNPTKKCNWSSFATQYYAGIVSCEREQLFANKIKLEKYVTMVSCSSYFWGESSNKIGSKNRNAYLLSNIHDTFRLVFAPYNSLPKFVSQNVLRTSVTFRLKNILVLSFMKSFISCDMCLPFFCTFLLSFVLT